MDARKLSTIEMTVLGLAWLRGPCTTYAIMKELSASASSFHKSRAGTAYSVAKRLLKFGLLEAIPNGERIQITPAGVAALQGWMSVPVPQRDIAHSADLVRLRFFFLGVVDQPSRLRFIDSSVDGLQQFLQRCEELVPANEAIGDYFGVLATLSTILETQARIEWLLLVRKWVERPMPEGQSWSEIALAATRKPAN